MRSYERDWFGNNRFLCDVLSDMRKCEETKNFSMLLGLIEEAQIMGNRMEAALSDQKDLKELTEKISKLRKEYKELKASVAEMKSETKEQ